MKKLGGDQIANAHHSKAAATENKAWLAHAPPLIIHLDEAIKKMLGGLWERVRDYEISNTRRIRTGGTSNMDENLLSQM